MNYAIPVMTMIPFASPVVGAVVALTYVVVVGVEVAVVVAGVDDVAE